MFKVGIGSAIFWLIMAPVLLMGACGKKPTENTDVNIGVRDTVITECQTEVGNLRQQLDQLKKEAEEKDKKINWLRAKAKAAGADLTK